MDAWRREEMEGLHARIAHRFGRAETRERAKRYLLGLLEGGEGRRSGRRMAERMGEGRPDGAQRLLNAASWDVDGARDDLRDYVVEKLEDPRGGLVLVEAGFPKKGAGSAGVARQLDPSTGRVRNCQVGLFLAYASPRGRAFVDRELYLPKEWAEDAGRRRAAGVPEGVEYATNGELAVRMLERALEAGVPAAWVSGGEPHGDDEELRSWLQARGLPYAIVRRFRGPRDAAALPRRTLRELRKSIATWPPIVGGAGSWGGDSGYGWRCVPQGMSQAAILDKLNELLERSEPRESAERATRAEENGSGARPVLVGVRSFTRRAEDMDDEMDELLRLEDHFEDRHIRAPELWHEAVYPELEDFLGRTLNGRDRYLLHLSAHTSIAFACGFLLDPKSGVDVVPVQRTSGRQEWRPDLDPSAARRGSAVELWRSSDPTPLHEGGNDLVVAASVTHDVSEDVEGYAQKNVPNAGRMLHFEVMLRASRHSVRDGTHALLLADDLLERLRKARTPDERTGTVHLFAAAPAGLMFFAGRFARGLRRSMLYEYDFEEGGLGAYAPSLVLPPRAACPARGDTTGG